MLLFGAAAGLYGWNGFRGDLLALLGLLVYSLSVALTLRRWLAEREVELAARYRGFPLGPDAFSHLVLSEAQRRAWRYVPALFGLAAVLGCSWTWGGSWLSRVLLCAALGLVLSAGLFPLGLVVHGRSGRQRAVLEVTRGAGYAAVFLALIGLEISPGLGAAVDALGGALERAVVLPPAALLAGVATGLAALTVTQRRRCADHAGVALERAQSEGSEVEHPSSAWDVDVGREDALAQIHEATWLSCWSEPPEGWLDRLAHSALTPRQRLVLRALSSTTSTQFTWTWNLSMICFGLAFLCALVPRLDSLAVGLAAMVSTFCVSPFDAAKKGIPRHAIYPIAVSELVGLLLKLHLVRAMVTLPPALLVVGPLAVANGHGLLEGCSYAGRLVAISLALLPLVATYQAFGTATHLRPALRIVGVLIGVVLITGVLLAVFNPVTPFSFSGGFDPEAGFVYGLLGLGLVSGCSLGTCWLALRFSHRCDFLGKPDTAP